jgi:hypothetical protein
MHSYIPEKSTLLIQNGFFFLECSGNYVYGRDKAELRIRRNRDKEQKRGRWKCKKENATCTVKLCFFIQTIFQKGSVLLSLLVMAENGSMACKPVLRVAFSVLIITKFVASPLLAIPAA